MHSTTTNSFRCASTEQSHLWKHLTLDLTNSSKSTENHLQEKSRKSTTISSSAFNASNYAQYHLIAKRIRIITCSHPEYPPKFIAIANNRTTGKRSNVATITAELHGIIMTAYHSENIHQQHGFAQAAELQQLKNYDCETRSYRTKSQQMPTKTKTLNILNFPSFKTFLLKFPCTYKNRSCKLV